MTSAAKTVDDYLAELPEDRREAISAIRAVFRDNIQPGFEEGMMYGGPGFYVPHSIYPPGYHCDPKLPLPFAGYASQKNHLAIYLMCTYMDADSDRRFREEWLATGKKLDMGKSCIRFKKISDVPPEVVANLLRQVSVDDFIAFYERSKATSTRKR